MASDSPTRLNQMPLALVLALTLTLTLVTSIVPHTLNHAGPSSLLLVSAVVTPYNVSNPPQPIYYPDPVGAPTQAFEAPLPFATGLANNGSTLNIAVIAVCATPTNPLGNPAFTKPVSQLNATTFTAMATAAQIEMLMNPTDFTARIAFGNLLYQYREAMHMTIDDLLACNTGIGLYNEYYKAQLLIMDKVNKMCNGGVDPSVAEAGECGIPMKGQFKPNGHQVRVKLNLVFFTIGPLPFGADESYGVTTGTNAALLASLLTDSRMGFPIGHFPVIMGPPYAGEAFLMMFSTGCETYHSCISISAYGASDQYLKCIEQVDPLSPTQSQELVCPAECIAKYAGCTGQRRYDFGMSFLFDQSNVLSNLITHMRLKGAKTMALMTSDRDVAEIVHTVALADAQEKGLNIVMDYRLRSELDPLSGIQLAGPALSDDEALDLAKKLQVLDPDVLCIASDSSQTADMLTFQRLVKAIKSIHWMPRALIGGSGSYQYLGQSMGTITGEYTDGAYIYGSNVNEMGMRSRVYQAKANPSDPNAVLNRTTPNIAFEPFSYNEVTKEYPGQIFRDEYIAAFGNGVTQTTDLYHGNILPLVSGGTVMMAIKLAEQAGSDDPIALQAASYRVSAPSFVGLIQFDPFGRLVAADQPVIQMNEDVNYTVITPIDIATGQDVYPIPTWDERTFDPHPYTTSDEKAVLAVNSVSIVFLLSLMVVVFVKRGNAVMKASAPPFCLLSLLGGVITLASNYGLSLQPTATGCAVNVWLLSFGFTLMLAALLVKLGRLYFIFSSGKLTVVKITNLKLGIVLLAACLVDIVLNVIWTSVSPFAAKTVVVDPYRPMYNYRACDWDETAIDLMYVHIAWKMALLFAALVLTVLTRSLPAAFNESTYLGASIYNVSVLLVFLLPTVSAGVGGRDTVYLLQGFGVQLIVVSTMAIFFIPKIVHMNNVKVAATSNNFTFPATAAKNKTTTSDSSHVYAAGNKATTMKSGGRTASSSAHPASPTGLLQGRTGGTTAWAQPGTVPVRVSLPGAIDNVVSEDGHDSQDSTGPGAMSPHRHGRLGSSGGSSASISDVAQLKATIEQLRAALAAAQAQLANTVSAPNSPHAHVYAHTPNGASAHDEVAVVPVNDITGSP